MKISVLIPTYNRKEMVDEAVKEIIKYIDSIHEIIISDNHSSDGSLEHFKIKYRDLKKIKITHPASPCGPLGNWKNCLSSVSGTHIHWHWSDDLLLDNFYSRAIALNQMGHEVIMSPVVIPQNDGFRPILYSRGFLRMENSRVALRNLFMNEKLAYSPAAYILPAGSVASNFFDNIPKTASLDPNAIAMGADALMIAGAIMDHDNIAFIDQPMMQFRKHEGSITEQNTDSFKCYHLSFAYFQNVKKQNILSFQEMIEIYGLDIVGKIFPERISREIFKIQIYNKINEVTKNLIGI